MQKILTLEYRKVERVWAVLVGINVQTPPLKYAVNDAREVYRYLVEVNCVPASRSGSCSTRTPPRPAPESSDARRRLDKEDTVPSSWRARCHRAMRQSDGDGLEKYSSPTMPTQGPYATALPMHGWRAFPADQRSGCVPPTLQRQRGHRPRPGPAPPSPAFLDRLSQGKGRVLLTASDANEVSAEQDALQHGVFTYYLLDLQRGRRRDALTGRGLPPTHDGPQATGRSSPVKKSEMTGQLSCGGGAP
jgi:hypothetical protein